MTEVIPQQQQYRSLPGEKRKTPAFSFTLNPYLKIMPRFSVAGNRNQLCQTQGEMYIFEGYRVIPQSWWEGQLMRAQKIEPGITT